MRRVNSSTRSRAFFFAARCVLVLCHLRYLGCLKTRFPLGPAVCKVPCVLLLLPCSILATVTLHTRGGRGASAPSGKGDKGKKPKTSRGKASSSLHEAASALGQPSPGVKPQQPLEQAYHAFMREQHDRFMQHMAQQGVPPAPLTAPRPMLHAAPPPPSGAPPAAAGKRPGDANGDMRPVLAKRQRDCPTMIQCRRFLKSLDISDKILEPALDECHCTVCAPNAPDLLSTDANPNSALADPDKAFSTPKGYCAFGVALTAKRNKTLPDTSSWFVSYYGCPTSILQSTLKEGHLMLPGDALHAPDHLGRKLTVAARRIPAAAEDQEPAQEKEGAIYTSACIQYSEQDVYTQPIEWRAPMDGAMPFSPHHSDHTKPCVVRVVLQCKQKPGFTVRGETAGWKEQFGDKPISSLFPNDKIERVTRTRTHVLPYRILVGMGITTRELEEKVKLCKGGATSLAAQSFSSALAIPRPSLIPQPYDKMLTWCVEISGVQGEAAKEVNGRYGIHIPKDWPNRDVSRGWQAVWKKENATVMIEFVAGSKQWMVRSMTAGDCRRDTTAVSLNQLSNSQRDADHEMGVAGAGGGGEKGLEWMRASNPNTQDDDGARNLPAVSSWEVWDKAAGRWAEQASVSVCNLATSVAISGLEGALAALINGRYAVWGAKHDGRAVYRKIGGAVWAEYHAEEERWMIKGTSQRGSLRGYLRSADKTTARLLQDVGRWEVSSIASEQGANAEASSDATAWSLDRKVRVSRVFYPVHVTGVTGQNAALANGTFLETGWPNCGRPTYFNDPVGWIEYHNEIGTWIIKPASSRGKGEGWLKSNYSCPWAQTVDECIRWDEHHNAMGGEGWKLSRTCRAIRAAPPVSITGVTGTRASSINGVYTAAGARSGDRPLYRRDGGDVWIEYNADREKWMIKGASCLGEFKGWMRSSDRCPGAQVVEEVPSWDVWDRDCNAWVPQDTVSILPAFFPVEITGVTGPYAKRLNCRYFVTNEQHDGRPVYRSRNGEVGIEFDADTQTWLVKRWSMRGEARAWLRQHEHTPPCLYTLLDVPLWGIWDMMASKWSTDGHIKLHRVAHAVVVGGITGSYAGFANGRYRVTNERHCGRPVYRKEAGDVWIEYRADIESCELILQKSARAAHAAEIRGQLICAKCCRDCAPVYLAPQIWRCYRGLDQVGHSVCLPVCVCADVGICVCTHVCVCVCVCVCTYTHI